MATVWYCTREDVKRALDVKETVQSNGQIDRRIAASTDSIEGLCHRRFYPWTGTRYLDWPIAVAGRGGCGSKPTS